MEQDTEKDARNLYASLSLTRRSLFEITGLAIATAALPPKMAFANMPSLGNVPVQGISPVMERLSAYMSEAGTRALPDETVEKTKQHMLDTLAAMISGSELPPGRAALEFARAYGGREVATVVASDFLCGPIEAALTNGVLAHADETDDSHSASQSHPGCAVIPAALAAGERFGIAGTHFLRAVALGDDIGPRFTVTLGGQRFEADSHWSTHSISPLFGAAAAAAAGCAANLNAQQMRWMLGYTAHQSSGLGAKLRTNWQLTPTAALICARPSTMREPSLLLVFAGMRNPVILWITNSKPSSRTIILAPWPPARISFRFRTRAI